MNDSSTRADNIVINTEALNNISIKTKMLSEKLEVIMNSLQETNNRLVSSSAGRFATTFQNQTAAFMMNLKGQIEALRHIELQATDTLNLNTEMDGKIASEMK